MKTFWLNKDKRKLDNFLEKRNARIRGAVPIVKEICEDVRENGDKALLKYIQKFDGISFKRPSELKVKKREVKDAYQKVDAEFLHALKVAHANIENFHSRFNLPIQFCCCSCFSLWRLFCIFINTTDWETIILS